MSELLLELFSEEIPARMQERASEDLKRLVGEGLLSAGLSFKGTHAFSTPRRISLVIENLPTHSQTTVEEKKGPKIGAPEQAIQGFLKSAGLASVREAQVVRDEKRGDYYSVKITRSGRPTQQIVAEIIPEIISKFPWSKSMRWGRGSLHWIRPLQTILCVLEKEVVPFTINGIPSSNTTSGHRFHSLSNFKVTSFSEYVQQLENHKVILDPQTRANRIREAARETAKLANFELVEDESLVAENAGLTEWPVALMGSFDEAFLDVPPEVLATTMKRHQKCFSLLDPKKKKLTNKFILITNLTANDGGQSIIAGYEKVMRARLSDARFFWNQDLQKPLDEMVSQLSKVTFHERLGSQRDRVERLSELSFIFSGAVDANGEEARRAAQLAKADLVSEMVGEFPELQGLMGSYYAKKAGAKIEIARAIEYHYKPKGINDLIPKEENHDSVAIAVALADKLDSLVGFWAIGEKPTGSGDPFQLRRAALGIIRIILENDLRVPLSPKINEAMALYLDQFQKLSAQQNSLQGSQILPTATDLHNKATNLSKIRKLIEGLDQNLPLPQQLHFPFNPLELKNDLLAFIADRLKGYLKEKGLRHDLIGSIFALPKQDDLALVVKRIEALALFLQTEDGTNLLAGAKRASSILSIEEKKDQKKYSGKPEGSLLVEPAERSLVAAITKAQFDIEAALNVENYRGAMNALADLRGPVDAFFEKTTVNDKNEQLRTNRLKILSEIRTTLQKIADFTRIVG